MHSVLKVEVKVLDREFIDEFGIPSYATSESACVDFRAALKESLEVLPGESTIIPTGLCFDINNPYCALWLIPRSGIGSKSGIVLGNLVGCIDSDYQGQIGVCIWNRSQNSPYTVNRGDRICQGQFLPVIRAELEVVDEFSRVSERGEGGFGSTGI